MPDGNKHQAVSPADFSRMLKELNPAQRSAVEQIDGPVLVLAGPGTGKTHILATRIGYILRETDTPPSGILCLTFTDAGVIAMRRRLQEIIGPTAHKVHIYTFHSFCNKVIQEHLDLFGKPELEPVSDLQRVEMIRHISDELPPSHPLRRGRHDPYFYEKHLADLFALMKSQDWTVARVQEAIAAYLSELPHRSDFIYKRQTGTARKGDLMMHKIEKAREKMELLAAAAALYDRYTFEMHQRHVYDFDDMILWVLRAFEQNEFLLRQYQEQYLYFLVDEYQDTNSAQNHILQQLIGYWDRPHVFIVGDDDQSIFEFQGARLRHLIDFYSAYRDDLLLVLLQDNYRSSQPILDSAHALIGHNEKRVVNLFADQGITKHLRARNALYSQSGSRPLIATYPNRLHEEADIVRQIAALIHTGVPADEIAIITPRHRQSENLAHLLEKKGIAFATQRRINILDLPAIRQLLALLEYIHEEYHRPYSGEAVLFKLLYFHFFGISAADMARLSFYLQNNHLPWRIAIADVAALSAAGVQQPGAFLRASQCLESLTSDAANLPLTQLVEHAINHSGWLRFLYGLSDRMLQLEVAGAFMDFVRSESRRHPGTNLRDLLRIIGQMRDNRLRIEVQQQISAATGVRLLTAHASKGLEFRYVFLPDCTKDAWEPARKYGFNRFALPDTLTWSGEEDALEARRRLFYVAVTRAKEHLYISMSREDYTGKALEHACFVDEIGRSGAVDAIAPEIPSDLAAEARYHLLLNDGPPAISPVEPDLVGTILDHFVMNLSALNRYLDCPLSFYFQHILNMPSAENEATIYGAAVHYALRKTFELMQHDTLKRFPGRDAFVHFFEKELIRRQGSLTNEVFRHREAFGKHFLPLYYDSQSPHWPVNVSIEMDIRNVTFRGVPLMGTLDRVDYTGDGYARIVDYKTGTPEEQKTKGPSASRPYGGPYWRQLVFYKILFEQYRPQYIASIGEIAYLDPDKAGRFRSAEVAFDTADVDFVGELIATTYQRIQQRDFYTGCGKPDCTWCQFVQYQTPLADDRNIAIEALDDTAF